MPTPLDKLRAFTQDVKGNVSEGIDSLMSTSPTEGVPPEVAQIFQLIKSQNPDIPNDQAMQMAMDSLKATKVENLNPEPINQVNTPTMPNNPMARMLQKYGGSPEMMARTAAISGDAYDRLMTEYGDAGAAAGSFTAEQMAKNEERRKRILRNKLRQQAIQEQMKYRQEPSPMGFMKSLMD